MNHKFFPYFLLKGKFVIISLLFLLFLLQSSTILNRAIKTSILSELPVIATVNGENITAEEFSLFINQNRAMTYNYFDNKYGIDQYSSDFWNSQFGVENPVEYIKETALQSCISVKLQQMMAQERGIIGDIDYSSFKDDLAQENARRKYVKQSGGIIYGPVEYTPKMYYSHVFSQMLIALKRKMAQHEFKISDIELKQEYDVTKIDRFRIRDQIRVKIISPRSKYEIIFTKLLAAVDNSTELEKLIIAHRDQVNIHDMLIDDETYNLYSRQNERLLDYIYQLMTGQSRVFTDTDNQLMIIKCAKRMMIGIKPFEEVKEIVRNKWIDDQYEDWLSKLERQADIRVNEEYLEEVLLDLL